MFIVTAKLNKKKAVCGIIVLAIVLCAIVILVGALSNNSNTAHGVPTLHATVKNNSERILYLEQFGWKVADEPLETIEITIPREFSDVYAKYNEIQLAQGFDLSDYGGLKATRYTYEILNYPDATGQIVADLIVYNNIVIAGDIQSTSLDGFMCGLNGEG